MYSNHPTRSIRAPISHLLNDVYTVKKSTKYIWGLNQKMFPENFKPKKKNIQKKTDSESRIDFLP